MARSEGDFSMKVLNKLERKFGKYAIKNLTRYMIIGYAIGYLIYAFAPTVYYYLMLVPSLVLEGQVWRLVTWVITPPSYDHFILMIIELWFYYFIGTLLENTMQSFLYNLYIFGGLFFTMLGSVLGYILCVYVFNVPMTLSLLSTSATTEYICLSLFLAVSVYYPDMEILLSFLIPVKMKWLSILYIVFTVYSFIKASMMGRIYIVMSLLNFIIFYFCTRDFRHLSPQRIKRKRNYRKQVRVNQAEQVGHRCAICGITDREAPDMQFRYCSKCSGGKEYCQDHLFTHVHK